MEKGNLLVLLQPAELIIIAGAAAGTVLIANPLHILKKIARRSAGVFKGSRYTRQLYLESLKMFYDLFNHARKEGLHGHRSGRRGAEKSKILHRAPGDDEGSPR